MRRSSICVKALRVGIAAVAIASGSAQADPVTAAAIALSGLMLGIAGSSHHVHHAHPHHGPPPAPAYHQAHDPVRQETWEYIASLSSAQPRGAHCVTSAIHPNPKRCRERHRMGPAGVGAGPVRHEVMTLADWRAWELYRRWASEGHQEAMEIWKQSQETPRFDPITGHVRMWNGYLKKWFY